MGLSKCTSKHN